MWIYENNKKIHARFVYYGGEHLANMPLELPKFFMLSKLLCK